MRRPSFFRSVVGLLATLLVIAFGPGFAHAADPGSSTGGAGVGAGVSGSVDTETGAATTSYAFDLPRASGVAQPSLAIHYNSARWYGDVAYGWSLDMPKIERTGLAAQRPKFDANDRFTFGGRELAKMGNVTSSSCPVAGCSEIMPSWAVGGAYYRLLDDTEFARFFLINNENTWKVQLHDGQIWEFGLPALYSGLYQTSPNDGAVDRHVNNGVTKVVRWNVVRQYADHGSTTPPTFVMYGWRHFGDSVGVLTDIYDTPGPGTPTLASFAHHTHLTYSPYFPDRGPSDPQPYEYPSWNLASWKGQPHVGLDRVDVAATPKASIVRSGVRRYHLHRTNTRGYSFLTSIELEGKSSARESSGTATEDGRSTITTWSLPDSSDGPVLPGLTFEYASVAFPEPLLIGPLTATTASGGPTPFADALTQPQRIVPVDVNQDGVTDLVENGNVFGTWEPRLYLTKLNDGAPPSLEYNALALAGGPSGIAIGELLNPNRTTTIAAQWDFGARGMFLFRPSADAGNLADKYYFARTSGYGTHSWTMTVDSTQASGAMGVLLLTGDVDGDGLADGLFENSNLCFSSRTPSKTVDIFGPPPPIATADCYTTSPASLSNASPLNALVDMNGDGTLDYVNTGTETVGGDPNHLKISVYQSNGDSHFGCGVPTLTGLSQGGPRSRCSGSKILLEGDGSNPLYFDHTGARKTLFGDLTGDRVAEIIQWEALDANTVAVAVFTSDFGENYTVAWSITLSGTNYQDSRFFLADLDGSGIPRLVMAAPDGIHGWDFHKGLGAPRPGLLTKIRNAYGAETEFTYTTVAQMEVEQQTDPSNPYHGFPWSRHSPISQVVVSRVDQRQNLPAPIGESRSTVYNFRDLVYDPWVAHNLGFAYSVAVENGDGDQNSLGTERENFFEVCPPGDGETQSGCPGTSETYNYRAVLGRPVVVKTFDATTGQCFSQTRFHYARIPLYTSSSESRQTSAVYVDQKDTWIYDTTRSIGGYGSWTSHDVDDVYTRTIQLCDDGGYAHVRQRSLMDSNGNVTRIIDDGSVQDNGTAIDQPIHTELGPHLIGGSAGSWIWRTNTSLTSYDAGGTVTQLGPTPGTRALQYNYDGLGRFTGLYGLFDAPLALYRHHETAGAIVALDPTGVPASGWTMMSRLTYDARDSVTQIEGGSGECTKVEYNGDPDFRATPTEFTAFLSGCNTSPALQTTVRYDAGFQTTTQTTDATGGASTYEYDAFGRLSTVRGPAPEAAGATQLDLKLDYLTTNDGAFQVVRANYGSTATTYTILDSLGTPVLRYSPADASDPGQWIASGLSTRTTRGAVIASGQPWFSNDDPLSPTIVAPTTFRSRTVDALGRSQDVYVAGVIKGRTFHRALKTEVWDAADLAHDSTPLTAKRDGHGRVVLTHEAFDTPDMSDERSVEISYTALGQVNGIRRSHFADGNTYQRWIRYDSLGRMIENGEPHTSTSFTTNWASIGGMKAWRYAYDASGRLVGTSDARGCGENLFYDKLGRLIAEDYSPCKSSQQIYTGINLATGDGAESFYRYDSPESGQAGDWGVDSAVLAGRLVSVRDRASHTRFGYDYRGRVVSTARRLVKPGTPAAALGSRYTSHWFRKTNYFGELDRLTHTTTGAESAELLPDGTNSQIYFGYDDRGLLSSVDSSYGALMSSLRFDADGAAAYRVYADAAATFEQFGYDSERRLASHSVGRDMASVSLPGSYSPPLTNPSTLQNLLLSETISYGYNGRAETIVDGRDSNEWPAGAKPVSRSLQYDGLKRLVQAAYGYADGVDPQVSPFAAEEANGSYAPIPVSTQPYRVYLQDFSYDWLGNLQHSADDAAATFDRSLGAVTNNWSGGKPGQLLSSTQGSAGVGAIYDEAGNLLDLQVGRDGSCGGGTSSLCYQRFRYEWNEVGQLTRARRWDYGTAGAVPVYPAMPIGSSDAHLQYVYGIGGRVLKTASYNGDPATYTADVFDTLRLAHATYDSGTQTFQQDVTTENVYLGGFGRVVYSDSIPTGNDNPLHVFLQGADRMGSTAFTIDRDTSELVERVTYQAYGGIDSDYRPERWESFREELRFTGKEDDIEVGLTYFGARYYSASLGRWASADPLTVHAAGADLNPYAYVGGQTYDMVDPTGLTGECGGPNCDPPQGSDSLGDLKGWGNAIGKVGDWFSGVGKGIGNAGSDVGSTLKDGFDSVTGWVGGLFSSHHSAPPPSYAVSQSSGAVAVAPTMYSRGTSGGTAATISAKKKGWDPNGGAIDVVPSRDAYAEIYFGDWIDRSTADIIRDDHPTLARTMDNSETASHIPEYASYASFFILPGEAVAAEAIDLGAAEGATLAAEAAPALRFSQTTASSAFSAEGTFAGNTIGGLAGDLRAGAVAAGDVPVSYVNLGGNSLIVNTRSSLALTRAGIPQSSWTLIDATATDAASIQARLIRNGLTVEGTPTLRITGLGRGASSLE